MAKANTLSWREDHTLGMEDDNKGIIVISQDRIGALIVHITNKGEHLTKYIKDATKTLFIMKKSIEGYEFSDIDTNGLIYMMDSWFYIPNEESPDLDAVKLHHDTPVTSHSGAEKIPELLQHSYF